MRGLGQPKAYLEMGAKRVFACAVDWPGWARAARTEEAALYTLAEYADRYELVAKDAGLDFMSPSAFAVADRLPGTTTTDFGAPGVVFDGDRAPVSAAEATRFVNLLAAAWRAFDAAIANAPAALRKGPRGGGRDRDKIAVHAIEADVACARKFGVKMRQPAFDDVAGVTAFRQAVLEVLGAPSDGAPLGALSGWPQRYAVRRLAWHALDHAWEIEDRS